REVLEGESDGGTGGGGDVPPVVSKTLTTDVDALNGTSGDDVFIGTIAAESTSNTSTYTTGDFINGGEGDDRLNLNVTSGNASNALVNLESVETVSIQAAATPINSINASGWKGVNVIESYLSTA